MMYQFESLRNYLRHFQELRKEPRIAKFSNALADAKDFFRRSKRYVLIFYSGETLLQGPRASSNVFGSQTFKKPQVGVRVLFVTQEKKSTQKLVNFPTFSGFQTVLEERLHALGERAARVAERP
jgi:hypothetical protein